MKRIFFGLLILLLLPAFGVAQAKAATKQELRLMFVNGTDFTVKDPTLGELKYNVGIFDEDPVPVGATIFTGPGTSAELQLYPNKSIIKLAQNTSFTINSLASSPKEKNAFTMVAGKVRAVASKGANYQVTSQAAVCAVRGTDFTFAVEEGAKAVLMVAKGSVDFSKVDDAGSVLGMIPVGAGMAADAFAESFAAFAYSADQFAEQFGDVGFEKLLETDVPEFAPEAAQAAAASAEAAVPGSSTAPQEVTPEEAAKLATPDKAAVESGLMKWLREALGFEIGSVTINEQTYSKAIIQPELNLGKVKLGLYLPVIYSKDLFNPDDWYKPNGNNEWDFGTSYFKDAKDDANKYVDGAVDLVTDVALKIKYFEYGTQMKDPFFIKVGNLKDLTLGHGLIMRNYANDTDFPTIRRIGFNMGLDMPGGGFEALTNDLTDPQIFGLRGFFRPVPGFKLAIGASLAADIAPGSVNPGLDDGNMMFLGTGVDLDLPIINTSLLGIRMFADAAATVPWLTESLGTLEPGLQYQLVYDDVTGFKNWGAAAGLLGNVLFLDWRLEYRYFTGNFRPSFFDGTYDRKRGEYAAEYVGYLTNPASYEATPNVMGVYGEGGFKFMKEKLSFTFGYMWPWSLDAGADLQKQLIQSADEFHAKLAVKKGLIPIIDVAGAITYDKRGLARSIADGSFKVLDENTLFGGELLVPVPKTPNLDLAILFQTVPVRNDDGTIKYADVAAGIPEMKPSVTIETRFHF